MNILICKSEFFAVKQNNGIAWKKTVHLFLFTFLIWWSNDAIILIEIFRKMLLRGFTSNIYQERSLSDKNTEKTFIWWFLGTMQMSREAKSNKLVNIQHFQTF